MADQPFPQDPRGPGLRQGMTDDDLGRPSRLETNAQIDPELSERPAGNGKIALFAIAIALVLGAVFYGLNNSNVKQASTAPPASQSAQTQPSSGSNSPSNAASNAGQGVTTGSATTRPTEPQNAPKGSEVDRANNSNAK